MPTPFANAHAGSRPTRGIDPGTTIACLGVGGFGLLAALLGRLEWLDAWVANSFEVLRGCRGNPFVRTATDAAPWVSVLLVALGATLAHRRSPGRRELLLPLALLGAALLQVQALKLLFERDRPGVAPWTVAGGLGYPSGHVANTALCAIAAGVLVFRGTNARSIRAAAIAVCAAWVAVVATTRLYLGRHWATDVVGAALLGVAFWGVMRARAPRRPRLAGTIVAVELLGLYLASAAGGRVHLPAPTTLTDRVKEEAASLRGYRLARVMDGEWTRRKQEKGGPVVRPAGSDVRFGVPDGLQERSVLKMVAKPLESAPGSACGWVEVSVDGKTLVRHATKRRWRTLAFPIPALGRGPHTIRLRFEPPRAPGGAPVVALEALSLESVSGALGIAPVTDAACDWITAAR